MPTIIRAVSESESFLMEGLALRRRLLAGQAGGGWGEGRGDRGNFLKQDDSAVGHIG